ncbi:cyclin-like protein interacting with PHO85 [Naganishia albida]|nr:cyclin-like protein interacting with PHO85 [Naganishia albida]
MSFTAPSPSQNTDGDVPPPTSSSATQSTTTASVTTRSSNHTSSPTIRASPRAKTEDARASTSLAAMVMDASASPQKRIDGFESSSRRGSAHEGREVKDGQKRSSPAVAIPRTGEDPSKQGTAQSSSPEESRSPRRPEHGGNKGPNARGTSAAQPTSNSDSSYTPASSPPPQTPTSDDATYDGDHSSSTLQKGKERSITDGTMEASSPADASNTPHMDLATYPTQDLLRLLASLLQQIASANDGLREEAFSSRTETHHPASRPGSPSSRNRTRQGSGEMAGNFIIPAFRPRPANAEGGRRRSHDGEAEAAVVARGSNVVQDGQRHEGAQKGAHVEKHEVETVHDVLPDEPTVSSVEVSTTSKADLTASPKPTASGSGAPLTSPETSSHAESSSSATTARNKKPETYRITTTAARQSLVHPSAILCFHARNVPSISIEAYLQRILKYCPITNEVFLSLLVYFDRMSKMQLGTGQTNGPSIASEVGEQTGIQGFAIDSFNVHRLVIAGITVASKFFSDVFYTNSRYAKVGGLPQSELNQLELQFLLLNDFNLVIPLDEMQRYADQLLAYGQGKGMVGNTGPGIVYGHLPAMKPPSEQQRDESTSPVL